MAALTFSITPSTVLFVTVLMMVVVLFPAVFRRPGLLLPPVVPVLLVLAVVIDPAFTHDFTAKAIVPTSFFWCSEAVLLPFAVFRELKCMSSCS